MHNVPNPACVANICERSKLGPWCPTNICVYSDGRVVYRWGIRGRPHSSLCFSSDSMWKRCNKRCANGTRIMLITPMNAKPEKSA